MKSEAAEPVTDWPLDERFTLTEGGAEYKVDAAGWEPGGKYQLWRFDRGVSVKIVTSDNRDLISQQLGNERLGEILAEAAGPLGYQRMMDFTADFFADYDKQFRRENIAKVVDYMQADGRWDTAAKEWSQLNTVDLNLETVDHEASDLAGKLHYLMEAGIGDDWWEHVGDANIAYDIFFHVGNLPEVGEIRDDFLADDLDDLIGSGEQVVATWNESSQTAEFGQVVSYDPTTDTVQLLTGHQQGGLLDPLAWQIGAEDFGITTVGAPGGMQPPGFGDLHGFPFQGERYVTIERKYLTAYEPNKFGTVVLPEGFSDDVAALEADWSDFETAWGVSPGDWDWAQGDYQVLGIDPYELSTGDGLKGLHVLAVNDTFDGNGLVQADGTDPLSIAMTMRNLWANTSANEHRWAKALQMAVAEEFGIIGSPLSSRFDDDDHETFAHYGTALQVYARAVYDLTQDYLAERGVTEIPLARGMQQSGFEGVQTADWQDVEADLNPLSSFSTSPRTARQFGAMLTRAVVPAEQVWGVSLLGHGAAREEEVIILGGKNSLPAQVAFKGPSGPGNIKEHWDT